MPPTAVPVPPTPSSPAPGRTPGRYDSLISTFGYVLAVSYPVLALSTGTRALYQLFFKEGVTYYLPSILSLVAASCYLVATIGFAYRRRWTWWLSLLTLGFETLMTLIVGAWSFIDPAFIGRTVWSHFGQDYGFFPLFQPLIGLVWLLWPATRALYGFGEAVTGTAATATAAAPGAPDAEPQSAGKE